MSMRGLSFGVLKEQEFHFKSKLGPQQQQSLPTKKSNRSRAYSLPTQQAPTQLQTAPVYAGLQTITEEASHMNISSNPAHSEVQTSGYKRAVERLSTGRRDSFYQGDPYSSKLAHFVSKMVFIIFWEGTESYADALDRYKSQVGQIGSPKLKSAQPPELDAMLTAQEAPQEFVEYTKYVLETMQISCSTALLALFYLHRLRPNVTNMFIPGTFTQSAEYPRLAQPSQLYTPTKSKVPAQFQLATPPVTPTRHQYRRDPKLEYRLFTISLILSNKYLDDNSYSNKAWSDITGLDLKKINIMEKEFLKFVNYEFLVKEMEYVLWVKWLESFITGLQEPRRPMSKNYRRRMTISSSRP